MLPLEVYSVMLYSTVRCHPKYVVFYSAVFVPLFWVDFPRPTAAACRLFVTLAPDETDILCKYARRAARYGALQCVTVRCDDWRRRLQHASRAGDMGIPWVRCLPTSHEGMGPVTYSGCDVALIAENLVTRNKELKKIQSWVGHLGG